MARPDKRSTAFTHIFGSSPDHIPLPLPAPKQPPIHLEPISNSTNQSPWPASSSSSSSCSPSIDHHLQLNSSPLSLDLPQIHHHSRLSHSHFLSPRPSNSPLSSRPLLPQPNLLPQNHPSHYHQAYQNTPLSNSHLPSNYRPHPSSSAQIPAPYSSDPSRTQSLGDRPYDRSFSLNSANSQAQNTRSHSFGSSRHSLSSAQPSSEPPCYHQINSNLLPNHLHHPHLDPIQARLSHSPKPRQPYFAIDQPNPLPHQLHQPSYQSAHEMDHGPLAPIRESAYQGFDQHGPLSDLAFQDQLNRRPSVESDRHSLYLGITPAPSDLTRPSSATTPTSSPVLLQPRKSSESVRVMPTQPKPCPTSYDRSFSLTSGPSPRPRQPIAPLSRPPIVYPALLSRVAEAFRSRILLAERVKDGLAYTECFDGREAVDKIAYIIKTTDRNLALLLGRALDAQKFFHDVTYDHRLRDSPHELYQFRGRLTSSFAGEPEEAHGARASTSALASASASASVSASASRPVSQAQSEPEGPEEEDLCVEEEAEEEEIVLPCGVFTLLTDCYSPTCTRDRLCYSIACPRRLEQQARLNLKPKPGLQRSLSTESLGDLKEPGTLWIHSVPQEVVDSVNDTEKKRQEAINECIYTERDFVRDLEYLRDVWIKPLQTTNIIPETRRHEFVSQVFWNVLDVLNVNARLCELLSKRQKSGHIVYQIADIYLEVVPHFGPFVKYGAHQLYGKYEFEREKSGNGLFSKFVDETERLPESRKLELNAYLTKPTTRLARYPLLLEVVLKYTPDDHPDKTEIPKVVKMIRELLTKVNIETGKSENRFNLAQLDQKLVFRQGEAVDLRLREEGRELIYKGQLKKRGGGGGDSAELQVYLFDHALLMVKHKHSSKTDNLKVYRKPIPLELLTVTGVGPAEEAGNGRGGTGSKKSLMARTGTANKTAGGGGGANGVGGGQGSNKAGFSMTLNHLGRRGYSIVLWAPTYQSRQKWVEKIEARQAEMREQNTVYEMIALSEGFFVGPNKVTCAAPFDNGTRLVFGTDFGVYLGMALDARQAPVRVIQVVNVTQVDVLEEHGILVVLADKALMTFWLDGLDPGDAAGVAKRARKISSNASFFKVGDCLGRKLVCVVKTGSASSTIKTLEPVAGPSEAQAVAAGVGLHGQRGRSKSGFKKVMPGNHEALKVYKEFYIPTESSSIHFLKTKLCVGCQKGFEIVDLESLDTQGLLDPADQSLEFLTCKKGLGGGGSSGVGGGGGGIDNGGVGGGGDGGGVGIGLGSGSGSGSNKPVGIYRVNGEFLLCYEDFAFYVNKNGWRARSGWIILWEGHPTAFALQYPFVLAFEPNFVEVRNVESGVLVQVIPGPNIRHLFSEPPPSSSSLTTTTATTTTSNTVQPTTRRNHPPVPYGGGPSRPEGFRPQIVFAADSKVLQLKLKRPLTALGGGGGAVGSYQSGGGGGHYYGGHGHHGGHGHYGHGHGQVGGGYGPSSSLMMSNNKHLAGYGHGGMYSRGR